MSDDLITFKAYIDPVNEKFYRDFSRHGRGPSVWSVDGGYEYWYDAAGMLHRDDGGPAERSPSLERYYWHGLLHREDGPAMIDKRAGISCYAVAGILCISEEVFLLAVELFNSVAAESGQEAAMKFMREYVGQGNVSLSDLKAIVSARREKKVFN